MRLIAPLLAALFLAFPRLSFGQASGNIQGIPTPWMYVRGFDTNGNRFPLRAQDGLIAYWNMQEPSNTNRQDDTCNNWTNFSRNTTAQGAGIIDFAATNASSLPELGLVVSSNIDARAATAPFSMAGWFNSSVGRSGNIFLGEWGDSSNQWQLSYNASGTPVWVNFNPSGVQTNFQFMPVTNIDNAAWHHLALTFDGTNEQIYVDSAGSTQQVAVTGIQRHLSNLHFFNDGGGAQQPECALDEWGYWTNAITQAAVSALFNNGAPPYYFVGPCLCHVLAGPTAAYAGGVLTYTKPAFPPYNTIYLSFNTNNPDSTVSQGPVSGAVWSPNPPAGTFTYDGPFTLPWNVTAIAIASSGCGCPRPRTRCDLWYDSQFVTNTFFSLGQTWSNNVVVNGGAAPGTRSVTNIDAFGAAVNNALIMNQTPVGVLAANLFASDSLIAAMTPCIYVKGGQPWVNHNFVLADVGANGITGNGSTKFIDSSVNTATDMNAATDLGQFFYDYNIVAGARDIGTQGATSGFEAMGSGDVSAGHADAYSGTFASHIDVISPGNGFYSNQRENGSRQVFYFANSGTAHNALGTNTVAWAGPFDSLTSYLFGINSSGALAVPTSDTLSGAGFTRGLNTNQDVSLFNALQAARTGMGGGFR